MKLSISKIVGLFLTNVMLVSASDNSLNDEVKKPVSLARFVPHVQDIPLIYSASIRIESILGSFLNSSLIKSIDLAHLKRAKTFERGELDNIQGARRNPVEWLKSTILDVKIQIQQLDKQIQYLQRECQIRQSIYQDYQAFAKKGEQTVSSITPTQDDVSANRFYNVMNPINLVRKVATKIIWGSSNTIEVFDQLFCEGLYSLYEYLYRPKSSDEEHKYSRVYHEKREAYSKGDYSLLLEWVPDPVKVGSIQRIRERERSSDEIFWEIRRLLTYDFIKEINSSRSAPNEEITKEENLLDNLKKELYELQRRRRGGPQEIKLIDAEIKDKESLIKRKEDDLKRLYAPQIKSLKQELRKLLIANDDQRESRAYFSLLKQYQDFYNQLKEIDVKLEQEGFKVPSYFHVFDSLLPQAAETLTKASESLQVLNQEKLSEGLSQSQEVIDDKESSSSSPALLLKKKSPQEKVHELSFCLIGEKIGTKMVVRSGKKIATRIDALFLEEVPKLITEAYSSFEEGIIILGLPKGRILELKEPLQTTCSSMIENVIPIHFDGHEGRIILRPIITLDLSVAVKKIEVLSLANLERLQELLKTAEREVEPSNNKCSKLCEQIQEEAPLKLNEKAEEQDELEIEALKRKARHAAFVKQKFLKAAKTNAMRQKELFLKTIPQKREEIQFLSELLKLEERLQELEQNNFLRHVDKKLEDEERSIAARILTKQEEIEVFKKKFFHRLMLEPVEEALKKMNWLPKQRLKIKLPSIEYQKYVDVSKDALLSRLSEAYRNVFQTDEVPTYTFKIFNDINEIWIEMDIRGLDSKKHESAQEQQLEKSLQDDEANSSVKIAHQNGKGVIDDFIVLQDMQEPPTSPILLEDNQDKTAHPTCEAEEDVPEIKEKTA